jgi:DNA-binding beta-propeller fold protein YncE
MNILTAEEITNLYLYGTPTTPTNLADESLIRPNNTAPLEISVDGNVFMQTGPGRFALPVLWDVVNEFFNLNSGLQPGTYTEQQLRTLLGISTEDGLQTVQQYNYDDGLDNYAERSYIWNSGSYEININAVFVVDANGNRHIENFAVIPVGPKGSNGANGGELDNFDFEGGGLARFFDAATFSSLADVAVGANPDSVTYTPNGSRLLVANEGEPSSYLTGPSGDPEGSVSVINARTHKAKTADFSRFDSKADILKAKGVRLTGPNATVSQDLEPEYIAVDHNGKQAFATLQEANAVAIIDIASATVTDIKPMGLKDHSLPGKGLDASDRDGTGNNPLMGNIQNWTIKGMYMPDGIANFYQKGKEYYVTANEGDSRADWPGGNDEVRVGGAIVDPLLIAQLTALHGADWQTNNDKLNRLTISSTSGDLDGDGDLDEIQVFGTRSFSILDEVGNIVFDSGDQLEQIIKEKYPAFWDDARSDNKGPEPESAVVGKVNGRDLLFLGLERSNAIMVWDLTDLKDIKFLDMMFVPGDIEPEGLSLFKNDQGSFLAVANEVSETTSLYRVAAVSDKSE